MGRFEGDGVGSEYVDGGDGVSGCEVGSEVESNMVL